MENFEIIFYETENGEVPAWDFITSLDDNKMKAKLLSMLEILSEKGTNLRLPYSEHLDDGIFELRCKQGGNITRVLYFFFVGKKIILTNGFVKKTNKVPPKEIKLAKERRNDYIKREGSYENTK